MASTSAGDGQADAPVSDRERSAALLEELRGHFVAPDDPFGGRTFLTELTAPGSTRRADAVWVGLFASRGYGIDVCELKVSRADFDREVRSPAKAEAWWPYSSRFWIVAPDVEVAPPERLPGGWGLLVPKKRGRRFRVVVEPAERVPQVDFDLMARVAVRLNSTFSAELAELNAEHHRERSEMARRHHEQLAAAGADFSAQRRLELLDEFEAAAGITLDAYSFRGALTAETAGGSFAVWAQGEEARRAHVEQMRRTMVNLARVADDLSSSAAAAVAAAEAQLPAAPDRRRRRR
jgi:hypothetical protein